MSIFDGYQDEGPVHGRPWWREDDGVLCRDDGLSSGFGFSEDHMTQADVRWADGQDRDYPRPCPRPMVGQVWRYHVMQRGTRKGCWVESVIDAIQFDSTGEWMVSFTFGAGDVIEVEQGKWPPPDAVLLDGSGAPWAPANYEVE